MTTFVFAFDEKSPNYLSDISANAQFLHSVRGHVRNMMLVRGHVFLNEVLDTLQIERIQEGQTVGWTKALPLNPDIYRFEGMSPGLIKIEFFTHGDVTSHLKPYAAVSAAARI